MPNGTLTYQRGEIRWVKLDPTIGAEIQKTRSCFILQNDTMNQHGQLTIAIPFRPGTKQAPYVVNVEASSNNGLDKDRFLDVAQIRAIDGQRVLGLVGILENNYWQQIQEALAIVCGFGLG
ncbi:type II toxin-antitoxin system PemK/MazF family toxin [Chamaesiphon sp.]|uniref:type II toxin-antitoxin system PemK/MazF family toxin n=1 Tax=Chamaesiphon sp. TaxID=2814140 RepID=UPI0035942EA0